MKIISVNESDVEKKCSSLKNIIRPQQISVIVFFYLQSEHEH